MMFQEEKRERRIGGLDALKCIGTLGVVVIHAPFPYVWGEYITSITRVAVPIFFMITGYFYEYTIANANENKQIKKVIKLLILSNLLYFIFSLSIFAYNGELIEYFYITFTLKNFIELFLFNESMFWGHLWYLSALLYVLLFFKMLRYLKNWKKLAFMITPILLMGDLILGKYSLLLFGREFPYLFVRNYLFVGIPYFSIGLFLRSHNIQYKKKLNIFLVILFIGTTFFERYILCYLQTNSTRDHYLSTTFLAIVLFILFANEACEGKIGNMLKYMGRNWSIYIYIYHPIFVVFCDKIASRVCADGVYFYLRPLMVWLVTIVFVRFYVEVVKKHVRKKGRIESAS